MCLPERLLFHWEPIPGLQGAYIMCVKYSKYHGMEDFIHTDKGNNFMSNYKHVHRVQIIA